jgi:hypothetical protein
MLLVTDEKESHRIAPAARLSLHPTCIHQRSRSAHHSLLHSFAKKRKTHLPDSAGLIHSSKMSIRPNSLKIREFRTLLQNTRGWGACTTLKPLNPRAFKRFVHAGFAVTPVPSCASALFRAHRGVGVGRRSSATSTSFTSFTFSTSSTSSALAAWRTAANISFARRCHSGTLPTWKRGG